MKAFLMSLDSLIGLGLVFISALLIFTINFQPYELKGIYLKQITLDSISTMHSTGSFSSALGGNSSAMVEILEATPPAICIALTMNNTMSSNLITITKPGCGQVGRELQTTTGTFVQSGNNYMVQAQSWYLRG